MITLPICFISLSTSIVSSNYGTRFGSVAFSANLLATATAGMFLRMHARRLDPQAFERGRPLLSTALAMLVFGVATIVSLRWPVAASALWWIALLTPVVERRWGIDREV